LIAIATQCFGPDIGGIETLMTGLADELAASGHAVEVFADRIHRSGAGELARPYPIQRFGFFRPVRRWRKRRALAARAAMDLKGVFADTCKRVFADSWKSIAAIPPGVGPIATFAYGNEIPQDIDSPKAARVRGALSRVRVLIASSQFSADATRRIIGAGGPKIVIVNPPLSPGEAAQPAALAAIAARIAGRAPVISTLSRLEPRKGVDMVIGALPHLRERFPGIVYLVAGGGDDLPRLRQLAAELGVTGQVEFLGPLPNEQAKAALFELSQVFAMPVRRVGASVEGFGIVYAEAGWRGVPSLAGSEGGAPDAVLDGRTGLVCRGDDADAVLAGLIRLLADEPLRARLGAAARQRAREELTWGRTLPRYLAALGL
jgi:phosphatidylinositol alpha-1,6-mannosyltransferase